MIKICLDAGHYGKYNRSPANKNYYESEMTWKLHLLLKKYLEGYGIKVVTTRADQAKDLALSSRGKKSKGCDLFISLHSNAVGSYVDESINYVAAYHLTDDSTTKCDDLSKVIAEALAPVVAKVMEIPKYRVLTRKSDDDRNGDGVMNDNYYGVLNGARSVNTPGILLEHSFHTNTCSTNWLLDDDNLDKLAKAEAEVIADYFGADRIAQDAPDSTQNDFSPYKVKVICESLNIRRTPKWDAVDVVGTIEDKGTYTIVAETDLEGTKFGKLKSGKGWISLGSKYVKRV